MSIRRLIREGAAQLSLDLAAEQVAQAEGYLELLQRWNRTANLTRIAQPEAALGAHLMDSFAVHPYLPGPSICDVGSGAGLPGLPLAILFPHKDFILIDSNGKKARFMTQACLELRLANAQVAQQRVEAATGSYAHVICRAFASLDQFVSASAHLLAPGGSLLALKGRADEQLTQPGYEMQQAPLQVPFVNAARRLCILRRQGEAPAWA